MENKYYIYIITNKKNGTLYIGLTSGLEKRIYEHKTKVANSFSKKYNLDKLVYFQEFYSKLEASKRERQLKAWNRDWKISLIEKENKDWVDLYSQIV